MSKNSVKHEWNKNKRAACKRKAVKQPAAEINRAWLEQEVLKFLNKRADKTNNGGVK